MNNDIKFSITIGSLFVAILMFIVSIVMFLAYNRMDVENDYLRKQIEEKNKIINYLKGGK